MKKKSKYPPYPGSGRDYAIVQSAAFALQPPNKNICIYCRQQEMTERKIQHDTDCPHFIHLLAEVKAKNEQKYKQCLRGILTPQEALDGINGEYFGEEDL